MSGRLEKGDGNARECGVAELIGEVAYCPQDAFLFSGTIGENIAFSDATNGVDLERMQRAAYIAALDEDIAGFPNGFQTPVGERIFEIFEIPPERRPPIHRVKPHRVKPSLEVVGVTFGYVPRRPVLKDINLTVAPGERMAVVGQTGAGKSSLMHLIAGLYTPEAGSIRIGGIDPRGLAPEQRRRLVGVVPQQVHIFEGIVLDNLRLGDESISVDEVWAALELANAGDLVRELPDGLNTLLGSSGLRLSSGQCQLLALARALVGNPRLLLLDEATSSVDSETERLIRDGLAQSSAGRTTLTVAHRLTTAQEADRVIVMADGRIVEEGHPDELVTAGGWYAGMLELQRLGWTDAYA